jgi:hypothetical protein
MRQGLLLGVGVLVVAVVLIAGTRGQEPAAAARFLRWAGFGLVAAVAGFFALFVVGDTLTDPGGWRGVALVAAWLLPLAACCAIAWWRPDAGVLLLAVLTAVVLAWDVWVAIAPTAWRRFEDENGPVHAIAVLAVTAAVALLGLNRTRAAGVLLVLIGAGDLLALIQPAGGATVLAFLTAVPLISGVFYLISATMAARAAAPPTRQSL